MQQSIDPSSPQIPTIMNFMSFLSLTSLCLGLIGPLMAEPVGHAQGELAGEVTATSVLLQSRLTAIQGPALAPDGDVAGAAGVACFEWSEKNDLSGANRTAWIQAEPATDFIVRTRIDGLHEGTKYHYRLVFGADETHTQNGPIRHFKTLNPNDPNATLSFCMGNCMNYNAFMSGVANGDGPVTANAEDKLLGYPVFEAMRKLRPDFFIGAGDAVYYDKPAANAARTLPQLRKKWHEQFRFPRLIDFFGSCSTYWAKDDHDFRFDDADLAGALRPTAVTGIGVFREQLPIFLATDQASPTYRTHRVHKHLQLWFMEGRDYRSDNKMPDGPEKSIWGTVQKQWLKRTLLVSDATWKVIITPTPMVGPDRASKRDNHTNPEGFQHEANAFFDWLIEQKMHNVLSFCGDRHWQYHSIHPRGFEEFSVGALNDENSITGERPRGQGTTDPQGLIKQPYIYEEPTGGFLYVTIGADSKLVIGFFDDTGKMLHQVVKRAVR